MKKISAKLVLFPPTGNTFVTVSVNPVIRTLIRQWSEML